MKLKLHLLHFAAAGAMLATSCGPRLESTTVPMSSAVPAVPSKGDGSLAGSIHAQVNAHRGAIGRSHLPRHAGLDRLALQHSEFMLKNRGKFAVGSSSSLSHYGFEERAMAAQRLMGMSNVAENIATCSGGFTSPASTLVGAWKKSSGHAKNLKGRWDVTGIGVAVAADGTVFATQLFATEDRSHRSATDRMRHF
jgi:uncharacterized protein YkwD